MKRHFKRLTDEQRQSVVDLVNAGEPLMVIARRTAISTFSIRDIANKKGLVIQKVPAGTHAFNGRKGKVAQKETLLVRKETPISLHKHYTGCKYSLRW